MTVQWPFMQDNLVLESRWQELIDRENVKSSQLMFGSCADAAEW